MGSHCLKAQQSSDTWQPSMLFLTTGIQVSWHPVKLPPFCLCFMRQASSSLSEGFSSTWLRVSSQAVEDSLKWNDVRPVCPGEFKFESPAPVTTGEY
jgi:hypothetical protein